MQFFALAIFLVFLVMIPSASAEEHNIYGGLGESISRTIVLNNPVPQEFVGTKDTFGESGTPSELMKKLIQITQ